MNKPLNRPVTANAILDRPTGMPGMDPYDFDDKPFLVFWEITRAYGIHGDPFAADPSCSYQPKAMKNSSIPL